MEKKSSMYKQNISKKINNNRQVFYGMDRDNSNIINNKDIRKKINDIINSPTFIYCTNVHILIGNETINKKIIGIYNNNLITIDNECIPLDTIKDIYK